MEVRAQTRANSRHAARVGPEPESTWVVRKASPADWQPYRSFRLQALQTDPSAFGSSFEEEEQFPSDRWKRRLNSEFVVPLSQTWLAEEEERNILGSVVAAHAADQFHSFAMWVTPTSRNLGIAGELLEAALEWIRAFGMDSSVRLEVNPSPGYAVRLYQSRSFGFTGVSTPIGHAAGVSASETVL